MDPTPGQRDLLQFAQRSATFGQSDRYREATLAELYYLGKQYEGRGLKAWSDRTVPLRQRKPSLIIPLYREVAEQLVGFVWCGHRFPIASVEPTRADDEADSPDEIGPKLSTDDAAKLTSFTRALVKTAFLERSAKEATRKALQNTSCAFILGVRGGHITAHVEPGKHCTPVFRADNPRELQSLEIVYQVERQDPTSTGVYKKAWYWYRREITEVDDIVYQEVKVAPGLAPTWTIDTTKSVTHDLGFCPVAWWRTLPDSSDPIDGTPVVDPQLYPIIDAVNRSLSQRDRAITYNMDPQPIRRGVLPKDRVALDKSPYETWDLSAEADFHFAETTGEGARAGTEHIDDLSARFRNACRVVVMDPKTLTGDVSGRVLEMIHDPLVKLASDLRGDLGDDGFCTAIAIALRIVAVVVGRGEQVWIPGANAAAKILNACQLAGPYLNPPISLSWPPFFEDSATDKQARVTTAQAASGGVPLISVASARKSVADIFEIEDLTAEADALEDEKQERMATALATAQGSGSCPCNGACCGGNCQCGGTCDPAKCTGADCKCSCCADDSMPPPPPPPNAGSKKPGSDPVK